MAWTERYITDTGAGAHDGTSEANAWTLAECIAAPYAAGQRINVKIGALDAAHAQTTNNRTFGVAATTTAPVWFRGYRSTIGDLDNDFVSAKPLISFTTGRFLVTTPYHLFSSLSISGAQVTAGNGQVRCSHTSGPVCFDRCRIECTAANANGRALGIVDAGVVYLSRSWLKATSSAPVVVFETSATGNASLFVANAFEGGQHGILFSTAPTLISLFDAFRTVGGDAYRATAAARLFSLFPTISSPGSDGFEFTVAPGMGAIVGAVYGNAGGWGINNSTGTNTANIFRLFNDYFIGASGNETGFGDFPAFMGQTDASSPWVSASDLSLVAGATGARQLFPGLFENESFTGYGDLGAVQAVAAAGGNPVGQCCM